MRYLLLLMLLMVTMAEAQYTLPYELESTSDSATINIRIGEEPTPPQRHGGSSAASTSYSGVSSVSKKSVQKQTATTTAPPPIEQPVEVRETFKEYNPDLKSGQIPASTTTMEYAKVPYWFVWLAGIALIFLIILLWKLLRHKTEQQHL